MDWRSRIGNDRVSPISICVLRGPRMLEAPIVPYVPLAGKEKARGLSHCVAFLSETNTFALTWLTRWPAAPVNARSLPAVTSKYWPDKSFTIAEICQLLKSVLTVEFEKPGV